MITLFPDEKIIVQSDKKQVILTSHRICYEYKEWGKAYNQSIMLEHITSCENYSSQRNLLLIMAIISLVLTIIGFGNNEEDMSVLFFFLTMIFSLLFWLTRRNYIVIGSPSTKMSINVKRMSREKVLSFINDIEQTKHLRLKSINKQ